MKLINDFFEVIALTPSEGELRCKVKFNPEHFIYKAHFPGNPVTPGVCLVQMAAEILGEQYHKQFMKVIPATKVLKLIRAEERFNRNMMRHFSRRPQQPHHPKGNK